jgi:HlyD family secretion protein
LFAISCTAVLLSGIAGAIGYSRIPETYADLERSPVIVSDIVRRVSVNGVVVPGERANVFAPVALRVRTVSAAAGERVRQGEVLARLDSSSLDLELVRRELAFVRAEAALANVRVATAVIGGGSASSDAAGVPVGGLDVRVRMLELREARLELDRVRGIREGCALESPIEGEVVSVNLREGDVAPARGQGPPAFVIARRNDVKIEIEADEFQAAAIRGGQRAFVYVESVFPGRPLVAHVATDPQLRRATSVINGPGAFVVPVKLDSPPDGLRHGVSARVEIETDIVRSALAVPVAAILSLDAGDRVIEASVRGGYRLTPVRARLSDDRFVAIEGQLTAGSVVLAGDASRLRELARELSAAATRSKNRP